MRLLKYTRLSHTSGTYHPFPEAHQNPYWGTSNSSSTASVWITTTLAWHNPLFWSPHNSSNRASLSWDMSNFWSTLSFTLRTQCFWNIPISRSSTHFTWSISNFIRGKSYISRKHQEIVRLLKYTRLHLKLTIPLEHTILFTNPIKIITEVHQTREAHQKSKTQHPLPNILHDSEAHQTP